MRTRERGWEGLPLFYFDGEENLFFPRENPPGRAGVIYESVWEFILLLLRRLEWTVLFTAAKGPDGHLEAGRAQSETPKPRPFDPSPAPQETSPGSSHLEEPSPTVLSGTSANVELIKTNKTEMKEVKRGSPKGSWDRVVFISKSHSSTIATTFSSLPMDGILKLLNFFRRAP